MQNVISPEDMELLNRARNVRQQAQASGISIDEAPVAQPFNETYIPIDGLPSKGLFYSGKLMGQPLKVEDMLLIQTINGENNFKVFGEIFARRFKGVFLNDILACDELYLALWLRANSYPGNNFPYDSFVCEHCEATVSSGLVDFNFLDMDFKQPNLTEVFKKFDGRDTAELTLKGGRVVGYHMRRRKDTMKVMGLLHRDFYAYGRNPPDSLVQLLHLAVVLDLGTADLMETVTKLQTFTAVEFNSLHNQVKKYTLSGDPIIEIKCPACKEGSRFSGYSFRPELYFPSDEG